MNEIISKTGAIEAIESKIELRHPPYSDDYRKGYYDALQAAITAVSYCPDKRNKPRMVRLHSVGAGGFKEYRKVDTLIRIENISEIHELYPIQWINHEYYCQSTIKTRDGDYIKVCESVEEILEKIEEC